MFGYVNRKRNQKGFTLMEMLIVVAIIAILVAVSIPIFTSQLEKSREATDIANMRAAKAEAVADYLTNYKDKWLNSETGDAKGVWTGDDANGYTAYYDANNGILTATAPTATAYGKGTAKEGTQKYENYDNDAEYAGKYIIVEVSAGGDVNVKWNS